VRVKKGALSPPFVVGHIPPYCSTTLQGRAHEAKASHYIFKLWSVILPFNFCFPGMSNPPYSPFSKGGFRGIFECSCPIYWAIVPDESGNYEIQRVFLLSTRN
jgi:hypothetical protein